MRIATAIAIALSIGSFSSAELKEAALCGTFPGRGRLELAKHSAVRERLGRRGGPRALQAPRLEVSGDLALMTDDGTIVSEANPFDLRERTLVFSPAGSRGFLYRAGGGGIDAGAGDGIGIGDDVSRIFDLSFDFPFLGQSYRRLFLNSDGNLSFVEGDSASTERSLERFLSGPPRIALFFADLDATAGGEVRVLNVPDRFVVTWDAVPEWGKEEPSTFQIEIVRDGTIYMRYGAIVSAASGIVGVAPGGGGGGEVSLVDLGGEPRELAGAIAERFLRGRAIDNLAVSRSFYRELADSYDSLVVWTNFDSDEDDALLTPSGCRTTRPAPATRLTIVQRPGEARASSRPTCSWATSAGIPANRTGASPALPPARRRSVFSPTRSGTVSWPGLRSSTPDSPSTRSSAGRALTGASFSTPTPRSSRGTTSRRNSLAASAPSRP
jgi:hypothetical protein